MAYVLPQVQVFQVFQQLPQNVTQNLNAFVFGPHYSLYKYGTANAPEVFDYVGEQTTLTWGEINSRHLADSIVDVPYVKVFMDDVWARYATLVGTVTPDAANEIEFAGSLVATAHEGRLPGLPTDVQRGDAVIVGGKATHVTDIKAGVVAAKVGVVTADAGNSTSQSATDLADVDFTEVGITFTGAYTGDAVQGVTEETVIVKVLSATALDVHFVNAGVKRYGVAIGNNGAYLGYGITVTITPEAIGKTISNTAPIKADTSATTSGAVTVSGTYEREVAGVFSFYVERGGHMVADTQVKHSHGEATLSNALTAVTDYTSVTDDDAEYLITCTKHGTVGDAGDDPATMPEFKFEDISGRNSPRYNQRIYADVGVTVFGATTVTATGTDQVKGDAAVIQVKAAKPRIAIYDNKGIDGVAAQSVVPETTIPLGYSGLTALVTSNSAAVLNKGDIFTVTCEPARDGSVRYLTLADAVGAPNDSVSVEFHVVRSGVEIAPRSTTPGVYNWQANADGIALSSGITVTSARVPDRRLPVVAATTTVEYRTLRTEYADTIRSVDTVEDAQLQLGAMDPDNPLAGGVAAALLNSGGRTVYFMATPTGDADGYAHVLDRASLSSDVYALAPMTDDRAVVDAISAHILAMSTETTKHWRLGFFSVQSGSAYEVYSAKTNPGGDNYLATITAHSDGTYRLLTFVQDDGSPDYSTVVIKDVRVGDKVRIDFRPDVWGEMIYDEFKVSRVISNNQLLLSTPYEDMGGALTIPSKVEVYHDYTPAEMVEATAATSQSFYHRRLYNVYPVRLYKAGVRYAGMYGAAAVAGLLSSVPPQQPLTNITISGFDDAPSTYQTLNRTQLNTLAEYGTLILAQDYRNGPIYIRHQVSTKAKEGNLNETELSLVKNADSISYFFANRFRPYIGKYNITPELVATIDVILKDGLAYLSSLTAVGELGPQLIADETEVGTVAQHPVLKDHVVAQVTLGMPKPFNVLQLQLVI